MVAIKVWRDAGEHFLYEKDGHTVFFSAQI